MSTNRSPSLGVALRNFFTLALPMLVLIVVQWPFKVVSDLLDRPIDALHGKIERILGPKR